MIQVAAQQLTALTRSGAIGRLRQTCSGFGARHERKRSSQADGRGQKRTASGSACILLPVGCGCLLAVDLHATAADVQLAMQQDARSAAACGCCWRWQQRVQRHIAELRSAAGRRKG